MVLYPHNEFNQPSSGLFCYRRIQNDFVWTNLTDGKTDTNEIIVYCPGQKNRSVSGRPTVSPESAPTLNFLLGCRKKKKFVLVLNVLTCVLLHRFDFGLLRLIRRFHWLIRLLFDKMVAPMQPVATSILAFKFLQCIHQKRQKLYH